MKMITNNLSRFTTFVCSLPPFFSFVYLKD